MGDRKVLLWLVLLLAAAGCRSSEMLRPSDPRPTALPAVATAAAETLVPVTRQLDVLRIFASVPAGATRGCHAVAGCTSGSWEVCANPGGFDATFDGCRLEGEVIHGTLRATGSGVAGTVAFDLAVDDRRYDGFVTFAGQGGCVFETFADFAIRDGARQASLSGELTYCPEAEFPAGRLQIDGAGATATFAATLDGTPSVDARYGPGDGPARACKANLATGRIACDPIEDS